jgi:hypothetical protein
LPVVEFRVWGPMRIEDMCLIVIREMRTYRQKDSESREDEATR